MRMWSLARLTDGPAVLRRMSEYREGSAMATIDTIAGLDPKSATRFRKSRVRTTEALLKRGATRSGRKDLAAATRLDEKQILVWLNRADLMRVKGIGPEYSDLLEAAGVDTVKELRRRNPASLTKKMIQINESQKLVQRLPTEGMVERWVGHAAQLDPIITY
jgi:predicted flap endonuclease-1-like 5' DNA nuclease